MKLFFFLILFSNLALARWATKADEAYVLSNFETTFTIKKDGSYTQDYHLEYEVLKDTAIPMFSKFGFFYSPSATRIKNIETSITNGAVIVKLPQDKITDIPPRKKKVFDSSAQIQISYPDVAVGSKITLNYSREYFKVPLVGHFSITLPLGQNEMIEKGSIHFRSEIPLQLKLNDPNQKLKLAVKKKDQEFDITVSSPILTKALERGMISADQLTFIKISSFKTWDQLKRQMKAKFDVALNSTPPAELAAMVKEAQKQRELKNQLRVLITQLHQRLAYSGDFLTIEGSSMPRMMKEVLASKTADAKEFAILLTHMMRSMKLNAHVALTQRSHPMVARFQDDSLPTFDLFNHAIVKLESEGESYWIDPTHSMAYGLNHNEDLMDNYALAMDEDSGTERIPYKNPDRSSMTIEHEWHFQNQNTAQARAELRLNGEAAFKLIDDFAKSGKETLEAGFTKWMGIDYGPQELVFKHNLGKQPVYAPLVASATYKATSMKLNVPNMRLHMIPLMLNTHEWVGDLYLGEPRSIKRTLVYQGMELKERPSKGCDIKSIWVNVKRTYYTAHNKLQIRDEVDYLVPFIPNASLKSKSFQRLKDDIFNCQPALKIPYSFVTK